MHSVTPLRPVVGEAPSSTQPSRSGCQNRLWRIVTLFTLVGLIGWLVLTVVVVWFARDLDQWTIARVPAGYWWAAQGAIGGYILIIVVYCGLMEWLEARHRCAEPDEVTELPGMASPTGGKEFHRHG